MLRSSNYLLSKSLSITFLMVALSACGAKDGSENTSDSDKNVDKFRSYAINIEKPKVNFADVFEEVELMQLEETDQSLLSEVGRLTSVGDKLIFPGYDNGDVYIFSNKGKFLNKFNNTGEGDGQYSSIQDLWVEGNAIVVYDSKKRTAFWYSNDGDYLKSLKMPEGTGHMYPLKNGYLTDMSFAPMDDSVGHKVWFLNGQLETKNALIPYRNRISFPMGRNTNSFKLYGEELIFNAIYGDTTYFIDAEGVRPFFHIDFGDKYLWNDKSLMESSMAAMMAIPKGEGVWNYTPYVSSDKIYMTYDISLKKLAAIIDRKTGEYRVLKTFKKNEERYDLSPLRWDHDRFVFSIPPTNVVELLGGLKEEQWQFREGTTLEGIESSENPVLVWVKFKDVVN